MALLNRDSLEGPGLPYKRAVPDLNVFRQGSWSIRGIIAGFICSKNSIRRARTSYDIVLAPARLSAVLSQVVSASAAQRQRNSMLKPFGMANDSYNART
jgi:hypothetical protein